MPSKSSKRNARTRRAKPRVKQLFPFDSMRIRNPSEEVKLYPLSSLSQAYYNAAAGQYMVDLTSVTQGASGAQRVGDVLYAMSLHIRLILFNGTGTTANSRNVSRIIFFQYFGDNSVANKPIISDFLQVVAANVGTTYGSFSTFDIDYARQYRVLWDSGLIVTVGTSQLAVLGVPLIGVYHSVDISVPLKNAQRSIAYYTGGATGPNHIYMLVTADQATQTTNPTVTYSSEFRFADS